MRRFRFRLDPLLRVRAQLERSARRELAQASAVLNQVEQRLAAAAQGVRDCAEQGAAKGPVAQLARALETGLRRHEWRLRTEQKLAQSRLDAVRGEYVQKARDRRVLESLRDQRHDEWRATAQRAEQAELDELARLCRAADAADHGYARGDRKA